MVETLGWKENSIRGAMSLYAKKTKATIASEKKDGVRTYYLGTETKKLGLTPSFLFLKIYQGCPGSISFLPSYNTTLVFHG